ncbi:L-fuculose-phosphate aldolase [Carboxydocella sporoproducens DSM 16521]|uniref:L-fuculose-phosphate aldolase n=3 Tax=Clostridiales Family XVI. Incertae Sedis TaxID=543347 RepID=A0A1T4PYE8_9FIRM|nr:L-fuculose-phosphate aldolase [Carboxydocella thermautotrophica]AVX30895.1 L-fuculose-phosphate aldolase [Carboxydocella thermautotrophica]SJZ95998.1 L-fuculose-phosphate aldolase [Carboxydocella sporoproducens DSM 16521]
MLNMFQLVGRDLFQSGLNNSHSGNLSIRQGDRIIITRRGAMLGHLTERDLIETGLEKNDCHITLASTEIRVHRAIYRNTAALAIVHAHPVFATTLSLLEDEIIPVDSEGAYLLHKIPVLSVEHTVGSQEVEQKLPDLLKEYKIVMVRGHGSFAIGQLLEEAYQLTASLEHSCKIAYYTRLLKERENPKAKTKQLAQW